MKKLIVAATLGLAALTANAATLMQVNDRAGNNMAFTNEACGESWRVYYNGKKFGCYKYNDRDQTFLIARAGTGEMNTVSLVELQKSGIISYPQQQQRPQQHQTTPVFGDIDPNVMRGILATPATGSGGSTQCYQAGTYFTCNSL